MSSTRTITYDAMTQPPAVAQLVPPPYESSTELHHHNNQSTRGRTSQSHRPWGAHSSVDRGLRECGSDGGTNAATSQELSHTSSVLDEVGAVACCNAAMPDLSEADWHP